jgi:hypothetical protein
MLLMKPDDETVCSFAGMEPNAPVQVQENSSPVDLILKQKQKAIQAAPPSGEYGGIFSQLASNPLFTAVSIFPLSLLTHVTF